MLCGGEREDSDGNVLLASTCPSYFCILMLHVCITSYYICHTSMYVHNTCMCVWFNYIVSSIILVLSIVVILVVLYYFSVCCERGAKCNHALSFTVGSCEGVVCSLRVFLCTGHYQRSFFSKDSKFSFPGCSFKCVMLSRPGIPPPS